jgi:hypothetical protein
MPLTPFPLEQFGGLNVAADPVDIGLSGAVDLLNVDFGRLGALRTRPGATKLNATTPSSTGYLGLVRHRCGQRLRGRHSRRDGRTQNRDESDGRRGCHVGWCGHHDRSDCGRSRLGDRLLRNVRDARRDDPVGLLLAMGRPEHRLRAATDASRWRQPPPMWRHWKSRGSWRTGPRRTGSCRAGISAPPTRRAPRTAPTAPSSSRTRTRSSSPHELGQVPAKRQRGAHRDRVVGRAALRLQEQRDGRLLQRRHAERRHGRVQLPPGQPVGRDPAPAGHVCPGRGGWP